MPESLLVGKGAPVLPPVAEPRQKPWRCAWNEAEHFDVFYSSVLARAVETADVIAAALDLTPARQDCDLCELHPGECDGMSWEEQVRRYGPGDTRDPDQPMSPGGESVRSFDLRVRDALRRLIELHTGESVAAVTHGGFITASMLALLDAGRLGDARVCSRSGIHLVDRVGPGRRLTTMGPETLQRHRAPLLPVMSESERHLLRLRCRGRTGVP